MTAKIKQTLKARLTERFKSAVAFAAAWNEILSAEKYPSYLAGIIEQNTRQTLTDALFAWAERRGNLWN